jgi:ring-1,2-phenylacetyl-CoA epoxidase subunit PaaB
MTSTTAGASLDPRVNRLPSGMDHPEPKVPLDQLTTFEVFVQPKPGKPFQHEGIVHASDIEMAYLFAKESFTRRFTCSSLCVAPTSSVVMSPMTEGQESAFDRLAEIGGGQQEQATYEVFVLLKRGRQHVHAGSVQAANAAEAMESVRGAWTGKAVFNVWAIPKAAFRFTGEHETDLWSTLPEKKFRDAADYKGGEKLKQFLENKTK